MKTTSNFYRGEASSENSDYIIYGYGIDPTGMNIETSLFDLKYARFKNITKKHKEPAMSGLFRSYISVVIFLIKSSLIFTLFIPFAHSAEVTLNWNPVARADGYKVYYGSESRNYGNTEDVVNNTRHIIQLDQGIYFIAITAYNSYGESGFSEEVTATITNAVNLVSDLVSPQQEGALVTFTAEAIPGSDDYEYKFFIKNPSGLWQVIQNYSSSDFFILDTTGFAGAIMLQVWIRDAGPEFVFQGYDSLDYVILPSWIFDLYSYY